MAESTGALWEGQLTVAMEEMTGNHGRTVSAEKERERKEHIVQVGDLHGLQGYKPCSKTQSYFTGVTLMLSGALGL